MWRGVKAAGGDLRRLLVPVLMVAMASCGGSASGCPGGPVTDPGARLSPDESGTEVMAWRTVPANADPSVAGLLALNTSAFRFESDVAVVGDGVAVPLADGFEIRGCGPEPGDLLRQARFGATFYADPQTGELVRAGCNGCE